MSPEQQPNVPITPEQLARDAEACCAAGASIYHLHVRDASGAPTMDPARFAAGRDAITAASDLIVQFSSGGAVSDDEASRSAPLDLRPEMATLTTGTVNFGSEVFMNPAPLVERFYLKMRSLGILPEFEIFEPGMIANAIRLMDEHGDGHHAHFDLVLGVPGAMPAWDDSVAFLVAHLPQGATWSATGIGRAHPSVLRQTLALGGNIRTGFEDVIYLEAGVKATSNAQLVERVAEAARIVGRAIATPDVARSLLGLN